MTAFITILHVVVCIVLILVVLLQAGRGASMGAAFGGSSQTLFGSTGPGTFLGKMTTVIAMIFMLTSLALSYSTLHRAPSLMESTSPPKAEKTLPQAPVQQSTGPTAPAQPAAPASPEKPAPTAGK
ncbi:MAG: preprotein translocase subunit SecG [Deltaproteobacteria bacterium]|nr:preprotein translocase subunit SecG [Deltaproteobacteria bacterium]